MESILNQLLAIQGATEQQTIDGIIEARTEAARSPQEREKAPDGENPPPEGQSPIEGPQGRQGPQKRDPPAAAEKPSQEMLEAWRMAFRIFTRYAPALRRAAAHDGETNEEACKLFTESLPEVEAIYKIGGDAEILAAHVYDMLSDAWQRARGGETGRKESP